MNDSLGLTEPREAVVRMVMGDYRERRQVRIHRGLGHMGQDLEETRRELLGVPSP